MPFGSYAYFCFPIVKALKKIKNDFSDWRQAKDKLRPQTAWFITLMARLLENDIVDKF